MGLFNSNGGNNIMVNYLNRRIAVRKRLASNAWSSDQIVLDEVFDFSVSKGIGKKKDSFSFRVNNANNKLFETFFSGDGGTDTFTLKIGPVQDAEFHSGVTQKLFVEVWDGSNWIIKEETTDYSITTSGTILDFVTAPASGDSNIKVKFAAIETDDLIRIHRYKNTSSFDNNDIIEEGLVTAPTETINDSGRFMVVNGEGLINSLFNGLVFLLPDDTLTAAHLYIQDIIVKVNEFNQDRLIYGQDSSEWTVTGNATTSKTIQLTINYNSAIELIEELSSDEMTGNGTYIYYVNYDATNDRYVFNWLARPTASSATLTEASDPILQIKPSKDTSEVVNAAIYNCGIDAESHAMEFPLPPSEIGTSGGKWIYITKTQTIGEALINNEFSNNTGVWDFQDGTEGKIRTSNYPNDYTAYAMQFEDRSDNGVQTGVKAAPTSNLEFNEFIRQESRWEGFQKARDTVLKLNNPRFNTVMTMDWGSDSNTYVFGGRYTLQVPSFGMYGKSLRLMQIDYSLTDTDLHLKEDETTI